MAKLAVEDLLLELVSRVAEVHEFINVLVEHKVGFLNL